MSFKNACGERKQGGGTAERFALLTEDQAYLLLSLSRNTERVVNLKVKLIRTFGEYRRVADMRQREYLPAYHCMHDQIKLLAAGSPKEHFDHMNLNRLVNQVAGVEAGQRANAPVQKQAVLIVAQMLATAAMQTANDSKEAYRLAKHAVQPLTACTMLELAQ